MPTYSLNSVISDGDSTTLISTPLSCAQLNSLMVCHKSAASVGAANNLAAELFKSMAGVNMVRVGYKGHASALMALVTGEVHVFFPIVGPGMAQVKAGRLKALAVTTAQPTTLAPGIATADSLAGWAEAREGKVEAGALHAVLAGIDPVTGGLLRDTKGTRVPGFDLTFSAPKSVSVLFGVGDRAVVDAIRRAHDAAVRDAMGYVERAVSVARRGHGGQEQVRGLVALPVARRTAPAHGEDPINDSAGAALRARAAANVYSLVATRKCMWLPSAMRPWIRSARGADASIATSTPSRRATALVTLISKP